MAWQGCFSQHGPKGPGLENERRQGGPCHLALRAARFFDRSAFAQVARAKSPSDLRRLDEAEKSLRYYYKEFLGHHTRDSRWQKLFRLHH